MRFRFIHAADLHLDTQFEGVRRVPPFVADALRDASLEAFDALVSLALAREVAFVVLTGHLYDGPERGIRAQLAFRRGLERLSRGGITTVIADDAEWPAIRSWPEGVTILDGSVAVERDGQTIATVFAGEPASDAQGLVIGVRDSADDLPPGPGYWALHGRQTREIVAERDPWAVYPGTLQGRGCEPSERGAKGAFVVEVDGDTASEPEFVQLDRVRCALLEADVSGLGDLTELAQMLRELGESEAAAAERRSLLLRATLVGSGPVAEHLRRTGARAELLAGLRDDAREREEPFLWWEHLEDTTLRPLDHEALRRRGDFPGALLELADEVAGDPDEQRAFARRHLAAVAAPDLAQLVGDLPGPVTPERWQRAVELALDTLVTDET